jgi:type IV secretory pathway VirB2 component (pilin)
LIVLLTLAVVLLPQLHSSFAAAQRYADARESEWEATNKALESARCLRQTGRWLLYCDGTPFFAVEDPGQVLFISLWGKIAGRDPTLVDVARMNLVINTAGLLVLSFTLLGLGAFATSIFLLVFGPLVYLGWQGTQPHWAFVGATSMQLVLPLALIARTKRWLSLPATAAMTVIGLISLAFGALLRESIASMTVIVTLCAAGWSLWYGPRNWRRMSGSVAVVAAALVAAQSAPLITAARNSAYSLDAAHLPATHGMSHTLYIGLGVVENKFGLKYDDAVGREAASAAAPGVLHYSTDYFRVMGELYFRKWQEDPLEVVRIYLVKLQMQVIDSVLAETPPLVVVLVVVIAIQLLAGHRRWRAGERGADTRLAINLVVLAFTALFIVQGTLATPTRLYSMPLGPLILVLMGLAIENLAAWLWRVAPGLGVLGAHSRL